MSHRLSRKTTGFSHRRRHSTKPNLKGFGPGFRTGVSAETMKTTTVNTHSIAPAIAGSSQRGAREYQRKPVFYQMGIARPAAKTVAPQGASFRDILERELGKGNTAPTAQAEGAETATTQFLSGYWA